MAKLDKPSWRAQITNKTALFKRIEMEGLTAQRSIDATLRQTASSVVKEGFTRQMFEIQKGTGMGWSFDIPNTKQADAMARRVLNTKYTANLTKRHTDLIKEQITGGIIAGKSVKDIAADIHETAGQEIWEAKRLVRTEITAAASEGELEAIREVEEEFGIKMRYRFYATLDERTCPVCGELDLQDFASDEAVEGVNQPPMHPNCRCVIQPVTDGDLKEEVVRRGRDEDGKSTVMPPGMTYNEWKKEYVEKPQQEASAKHAGGRGSFNYPPALPEDNAEKVEQLEAAIKERFPGIEVFGLEKADAELVGKSYERMMGVLDKDPNAAKRIASFEVKELGSDDISQTLPVVKSDGTFEIRIQLDSRAYANHEEFVKAHDKLVEEGHFPKGTDAYSVLEHEAAHARSMSLYADTYGKAVKQADFKNSPDSKFSKYSEEFVREASYRVDSKTGSFEYPSQYSKVTDEELIAEAQPDFNANGNNAKPISEKIVDMLDEGWRPRTKAEKEALFKAKMRGL